MAKDITLLCCSVGGKYKGKRSGGGEGCISERQKGGGGGGVRVRNGMRVVEGEQIE